MSGYRLIHREQVLGGEEDIALWSLVTTPLLRRGRPKLTTNDAAPLTWRIWAACSDGCIRTYMVQEVSLAQKESSLTASALSFGESPTHLLQAASNADDAKPQLGCAALSILRNYAGQDDAAGPVMVAGMDLSGTIRLWELDETFDEGDDAASSRATTILTPKVELTLPQATGTAVALAPPRFVMPYLQCLLVAVAYLDGTISLVSTGIPVPTATNDDDKTTKIPAAGTVVASWGTGSALACRLVFRPGVAQLAASRQDGTIDLIPLPTGDGNSSARLHRLSSLATSPARALTFTTDGALMIAGNDQGRMIVWDVTRPNGVPAVVNHQAHATGNSSNGNGSSAWLWQLASLDGRRFVSLATDKTIRVWQVDQVHHQPLHSFTSSDDIRLWSISRPALDSKSNPHPPRLVAGSENGFLQVYSLVEKA